MVGVTEDDLKRCIEEYSHSLGRRKEDCFALLYLRDEFGKSEDELQVQVAWGGNDYGLDAFHIDKERHNLYLYQFKWSNDFSLFKDSFQRLISNGVARIFSTPLQEQNRDEFLTQLKSKLDENQAIVDRVLVRFIFNGDPVGAERSAVLDSLREDLESKKFLIDEFFQRKIDLTFEYRSNETKKLTVAAHTRKTFEYSVPFQSSILFEIPESQHKMLVGFIKLMDLHGMHKEMGPRFFERNIRSGLSPDKPANRAVRQALMDIVLQEKLPPEVFTFNHNGVTLAVERIESTQANEQTLMVEPRLLNGAQTMTTLDKFLQDNARNPALRRNEGRLQSIRVLCKIVNSPSRDFVRDVTIYNNKQNRVDPWNLHANDLIQLSFQDKFAKDLGIYYERQEKIFESLKESDLEELGVAKQHRAIEMKRLAQTFLGVQGEIDRMSRLGDVFENRKIYEDTFRESYLRVDSSKILLVYKIQFRLSRILDEILERGPSKYGYISNARNLVWALLIQGLLNDDENFASRIEQWGKAPTMEKEYTDVLREIASKKVRFMISDAVDNEEHQTMMTDGKYSFLRTKAIYQRCMDVAYKRERWTKRSL